MTTLTAEIRRDLHARFWSEWRHSGFKANA
jgi:hypothetical protein